MDFESTYKKYVEGNATDEEKAFVEQELEKAQKMTEIIDSYKAARPIEDSCDMDTVKRAQKKFAKKNALRALIISFCAIVLVAAIILASVFGVAFGSANKNCNVSQEDAKQIALRFVADTYGSGGVPIVTECKREIEYSSDLKHSVYVYEIDIQFGLVYEIELRVNAKTGIVTLEEISST